MSEELQRKNRGSVEQRQPKRHEIAEEDEQQQMSREIDDLRADSPPCYPPSVFDKVHAAAKRFATTAVGQFVIERADGLLKIVEDTAKWSLPQDNADETPLHRPLSWIPFLLMIITLRWLRFWLSVGAVLIGNSPVTPEELIYFVQVRRRKLRALRMHGLRARQQQRQDLSLVKHTLFANEGLTCSLRKLLARAICRSDDAQVDCALGRMVMRSGVLSADKSDTEDTPKDNSLEKEEAIQDLTVDEMLSQYATLDSADDSDYVPKDEGDTDALDTSIDSSTDSQFTGSEADSVEQNQKTRDVTEALDESVSFKANGQGQYNKMPKPLDNIKREPVSSDADSGNERTPFAVDAKQDAFVAKKLSQQQQQPQQQEEQEQQQRKKQQQQTQLAPKQTSAARSGQLNEQRRGTTSAAPTARLLNNTAAAANTEYSLINISKMNNNNNNNNNDNNSKDNTNNNNNINNNNNNNNNKTQTSKSNAQKSANVPVPHNPNPQSHAAVATASPAISTPRPPPPPTIAVTAADYTVSPATSTEDLFYSPIGSPTEFNAAYLPAPNSNNTSSPNTSAANVHAAAAIARADDVAAARKHVTPPHQQQPQQPSHVEVQAQPQSQSQSPNEQHAAKQQQQQQPHQQQQHQHQHHQNHYSQRYRGRNRR